MSEAVLHIPAVLASILWSTAFLAGKFALNYIHPLFLAGFRLLAAWLMLMLMLVLRRNPLRKIGSSIGWVLLMSLFQIIIVFTALNYDLRIVPGSLGAIIIGSSPMIASLMAILFLKEERISPLKSAGMLTGLAGITILALSRNYGLNRAKLSCLEQVCL